MTTKAQLKAQAKYDKNNTVQVMLKLNLGSDADIIAKLQAEGNKQGYIKSLVREDMKNMNGILSLDSIEKLLLPIAKKYEIKTICLFGSYARNEARKDSDVDLLIDGGNFSGLFEYADMVEAMKKALGRDVDVITKTSLYSGKSKSDLMFKENIEKELLVLIDE